MTQASLSIGTELNGRSMGRSPRLLSAIYLLPGVEAEAATAPGHQEMVPEVVVLADCCLVASLLLQAQTTPSRLVMAELAALVNQQSLRKVDRHHFQRLAYRQLVVATEAHIKVAACPDQAGLEAVVAVALSVQPLLAKVTWADQVMLHLQTTEAAAAEVLAQLVAAEQPLPRVTEDLALSLRLQELLSTTPVVAVVVCMLAVLLVLVAQVVAGLALPEPAAMVLPDQSIPAAVVAGLALPEPAALRIQEVMADLVFA